ncbi:hypothetical protein MIND_00643800 [Mycena indigotica]|uniref:Uncharacterized protein n=1 Tax=Mycena indigotica TaxID=2126181 RepID=A0A8H6STK4_9AGAR|nr:uncharacterized protein MIND_00643800 [Mycena indigotica]KAF7304122.1 hypothetical protein MIND_00643800 [Mycena indigotica]
MATEQTAPEPAPASAAHYEMNVHLHGGKSGAGGAAQGRGGRGGKGQGGRLSVYADNAVIHQHPMCVVLILH